LTPTTDTTTLGICLEAGKTTKQITR